MTALRIFSGLTTAAVLLAVQPAWAQDADPFAGRRPTTEAVGVTMPADFAPIEWLNRHYTERVTLYAHLPPMNGGVAFVGDSITDAGRWADAWPGLTVRNFGIGGDTAWGLKARAHQVTAARPDRIFLLIGTNDLGWNRTPEQVADGVAELLDLWGAELPETHIFVQSVLPRQPEFHDRITELNGRLRDVAADKGATFVDIHSAFVVEGGRLDPAVTLDDLHLTGEGYARWRGLIDACVTGRGACAQ